ncbi:hypothetical protein B566_EDAN007986 [Ephemera danica]|nr:hypothetical protein B566_EDAN007986 [Ephemera danica]
MKQQQLMHQSDVTDVCVGTSVGTITEPDCLGPCEPGTSVTLEGIVWHETEGGVLVVNVTWRGKTYVGTLLDCTKHDWAPPRFCDSPTSDLDARTPKGRGKRGRAAAATPANDLSNFTETRSSVHSKLRNGAKGRRGAAGSPAPPTVPPFVTPKPDNNSKRKGRASETEEPPAPTGIGNGGGGKRSRSGSRGPTISPPVSPVLLECPEPNCSKKYKHINGLKYHQSHAHGGGEEDSLLDSKDAISLSENDESNAEPPSVPPSPSPEKCSPLPKSEVRKEEAPVLEPLPAVPPQASSPSQTPLALTSSVPPAEVVSADKNLVKPGVLRFGPTEDSPSIPPASHFPVGVYCNSNSKTAVSSPSSLTNIRAVTLTAPTTSPVINIPQPPSVKLLPSSQSAVQQPSPLPPSQSLSQIPQSPQPIPTSVTPPSTAQPQDMASNKLCDKYKVKIPPAPQRPAAVQGLAVSPLKVVQPSKTVPLIPELGDKKDKSKVGVVLQGSPQQQQQQPQQPPQTQPQQLTIPLQQQQLVNKKKNRKSPASSPQPDSLHNGAMIYGMESSPLALPTPNEGREDVQSPAYSDISDDGAPVLESEVGDKGQSKLDKKVESQPQHNLGHYGIYPFYGQPPYLVPSVASSTVVPSDKGKDAEKGDSSKPLDRSMDKDKKDIPGSVTSPADFQQKLLQQQQAPPPQPQQAHYFPYGYVPGYPYNLDSYPMSVMTEKYMQEPQEPLERPKSLSEKDKIKDIKEEKMSGSNMDTQSAKIASMSMKDRPIKSEPSNLKEKQNENHQILKESIEMKSQMNDKSKFSSYDANQYLYRQQQEDLRRYYLYPEQQAQAAQAAAVAARRKEPSAQPLDATVSKDKGGSKSSSTLSSPKVSSHKDKSEDKQSEKKEQDKASKQEGVKPTMETQGPPPPTSSYAYIHPGYMQSPHYPFDPNVYRAMSPMIVNPYGGNPYLHPQMRYHGPEDLSRGPPAAPPKALDMLQHHASQYYSSHKIHELQERALKSPTPKSTSTPQPAPPSTASGPPSSGAVGSSAGSTGPSGPPAAPGPPTGKPPSSADGKDAPAPLRSPPPQRHVHTHHHTHVGLGYPLLPPGQYPAPYGAVLASQQAAAVVASVISPYPPSTPSK